MPLAEGLELTLSVKGAVVGMPLELSVPEAHALTDGVVLSVEESHSVAEALPENVAEPLLLTQLVKEGEPVLDTESDEVPVVQSVREVEEVGVVDLEPLSVSLEQGVTVDDKDTEALLEWLTEYVAVPVPLTLAVVLPL